MAALERSNPAEGHTGGGTSVATAAFGTNPVSGDTIAVFVITGGGGPTIQAPTDTAGNAYTQIGSTITSPGGQQLSVWRKENIVGGSSFVVTAHISASNQISVFARCLMGTQVPTSYNGDLVSATGSTANPASGTSSPAPAANSFFFAAVTDGGADNAVTAGSGWEFTTGSTQPDNTSFQSAYTERLTTPNTSSVAKNGQFTAVANSWAALVVSFAPAPSSLLLGYSRSGFHPGKGILNQSRFYTSPRGFIFPSGVTNYTLTADPGVYSLTGFDVGLRRDLRMSSIEGTYVYTGSTVTLLLRRNLPAASGSYSLTGQAVGLRKNYNLPAGAGSYSLSGSPVTLRLSRNMLAGSGTYSISGVSVGLRQSHKLPAASGAYSLGGQPVTLRRSLRIPVTAGIYSINGQDVTLTRVGGALSIIAASGAYSFVGSSVNLRVTRRLSAANGSYSITGSNVRAGFDVFPVSSGGGGVTLPQIIND